MRQRSGPSKAPAETVVKAIRRRTRKQHSGEEKIRIVLEGLRGEESIAELCRHEGIATSLYYSRSKGFLEAGKKRLAGDTARQATAPEVKELRAEAAALKEAVADLTLEIIRLVERSHLPTKRTLAMLGIPRTTFYRWYDRYIAPGESGLEDRPSHPGRVWSRILDQVRR